MSQALQKSKPASYPRLGEGVFLINDVANILLLPYNRVRTLMKGFWFENVFGEEKNIAVNFYGLIEFYTFFKLRELGVKASEIKRAHNHLKKDLGVKYPFAMSGIKTDGKSVWYEELENLIKVDGRKQLAIREFIVDFLHKIEFGENNLASRFYPLETSKRVVVDPKHQFGQPTVSGRNITVSIIKKMYDGGETVNDIAALYDLSPSYIKDALEYYKRRA